MDDLNENDTDNGIADSSGSEAPPESAAPETHDLRESLAEKIKKQLFGGDHEPKDLEAVFDVPVQISAVLGRASMPVHQLLKLGRGAVVELDRRIGEAIDIYVNNLLVARGEVVVVEDKLGINMTEIIKTRISR